MLINYENLNVFNEKEKSFSNEMYVMGKMCFSGYQRLFKSQIIF